MRIRSVAAITTLGLALVACGPQSAVPKHSASQAKPAAPWVRVTDPSGAGFQFPAGTKPTLSTSGSGTTRTYIANAGGGAVASVVIIPTPVELNVKNFVIQYPITLASQGNTNVKASAIAPLTVQGFKGFQTEVRYNAPPGPAHVYEQREAIQLQKYFVVISAVVQDNRRLTPVEIARAKAINAQLLRGFKVSAKLL